MRNPLGMEKLADWLWWHLVPMNVRLSLTFQTMGFLTAADERLHRREVPTITVEELGEASKLLRTA